MNEDECQVALAGSTRKEQDLQPEHEGYLWHDQREIYRQQGALPPGAAGPELAFEASQRQQDRRERRERTHRECRQERGGYPR
jgi:hypothetical protein